MIINGKKSVLIPHVTNRKLAQREHDEILATAMLLGEQPPILCSCCMGSQREGGILWVPICGQCNGRGYDYIGYKTLWALVKRYHGEGAEAEPDSILANQWLNNYLDRKLP